MECSVALQGCVPNDTTITQIVGPPEWNCPINAGYDNVWECLWNAGGVYGFSGTIQSGGFVFPSSQNPYIPKGTFFNPPNPPINFDSLIFPPNGSVQMCKQKPNGQCYMPQEVFNYQCCGLTASYGPNFFNNQQATNATVSCVNDTGAFQSVTKTFTLNDISYPYYEIENGLVQLMSEYYTPVSNPTITQTAYSGGMGLITAYNYFPDICWEGTAYQQAAWFSATRLYCPGLSGKFGCSYSHKFVDFGSGTSLACCGTLSVLLDDQCAALNEEFGCPYEGMCVESQYCANVLYSYCSDPTATPPHWFNTPECLTWLQWASSETYFDNAIVGTTVSVALGNGSAPSGADVAYRAVADYCQATSFSNPYFCSGVQLVGDMELAFRRVYPMWLQGAEFNILESMSVVVPIENKTDLTLSNLSVTNYSSLYYSEGVSVFSIAPQTFSLAPNSTQNVTVSLITQPGATPSPISIATETSITYYTMSSSNWESTCITVSGEPFPLPILDWPIAPSCPQGSANILGTPPPGFTGCVSVTDIDPTREATVYWVCSQTFNYDFVTETELCISATNQYLAYKQDCCMYNDGFFNESSGGCQDAPDCVAQIDWSDVSTVFSPGGACTKCGSYDNPSIVNRPLTINGKTQGGFPYCSIQLGTDSINAYVSSTKAGYSCFYSYGPDCGCSLFLRGRVCTGYSKNTCCDTSGGDCDPNCTVSATFCTAWPGGYDAVANTQTWDFSNQPDTTQDFLYGICQSQSIHGFSLSSYRTCLLGDLVNVPFSVIDTSVGSSQNILQFPNLGMFSTGFISDLTNVGALGFRMIAFPYFGNSFNT